MTKEKEWELYCKAFDECLLNWNSLLCTLKQKQKNKKTNGGKEKK